MLPPPLDQGSHPVVDPSQGQNLGATQPKTQNKVSPGSVDAKINSAAGRSSSTFYTVLPGKQLPPPNAASAKQDEATQSFLSSIPSRTRSFFTSIKEGFIGFGASVCRFLSSLMPKRTEGAENSTEVSVQGTQKTTVQSLPKTDFEVKISKMSVEAKQKRMDAFVEFFTDDNVVMTGIFRVSPSFKEMKEFTQPFLEESFTEFTKPEDGSDPTNKVASLFKKFIGAVDLFESGKSADEKQIDPKDKPVSARDLLAKAARELNDQDQISMLKAAIKQMKPENVELLKGFLSISGEVVAQKDLNRMDVTNLAKLFGPNLAPADSNPLDFTYNKIAELLIKHRDELFPKGSAEMI